MVRLTVLYNLQPYIDEEEFLEWRLTEHQNSNAAMPGVIRTDFAKIERSHPAEASPPYRFMTTVDWPDMDTFLASFYASNVQAGLEKNMEMLSNPIFLVSEILTSETTKEAN